MSLALADTLRCGVYWAWLCLYLFKGPTKFLTSAQAAVGVPFPIPSVSIEVRNGVWTPLGLELIYEGEQINSFYG